MEKNKIVAIGMTVFEIKPLTVGITVLTLGQKLFDVLSGTDTAKERLMPLSKDNNRDSDFICSFSFSQNFLFGSFVRLNGGEESIVLTASLDKQQVGINEMISQAREGSAGSIKEKVFFCLHENLIVISNAYRNEKALETYCHWLFREKADKDLNFCFYPKTKTTNKIQIKDIQSIKIADTYLQDKIETKQEAFALNKKLLKLIVDDVDTTEDFDINDIISATVEIKFKTRDIKKENATVLNAALRFVDDDNIVVKDKKGNTIRGSELIVKVTRNFEMPKKGLYNEQAIETEMRKILKAIQNGEMVN
jgi:hypothetical protein